MSDKSRPKIDFEVSDEALEKYWQPQFERDIRPSDYKNQEEYSNTVKESENNLSTSKQIRKISQRGYENVDKWTFDQAKQLINQTAANRWRTVHRSPASYVSS